MTYEFKPQKTSVAVNNGLLLIRIAVGLMIMIAGLQKALNPDQLAALADTMPSLNLPKNAVYVVFIFEIVMPFLLILGVFSRLAAGFILVYILIAILTVSIDNLFVLVPFKGHSLESEFIFILVSLGIMCLGSGDKALYPD